MTTINTVSTTNMGTTYATSGVVNLTTTPGYSNYPIFSNTIASTNTTRYHDLTVVGDLAIDGGDIVINGDSLNDRLARIESLLHIPTRDVKLEEKYSELKDLWNQYNTALENYTNWERLNHD